MNVKSVEKLEKSRVALTIETSAEEFEAAVQKVYKKQRGRIQIPGFRKGHAPRKIIEGMYGSSVFYEDAVNDLCPDLFNQAVQQESLDTVANPQFEVQAIGREGVTFKATVAVRPVVTLGTYKGLTAPKRVAEVTEADIDNELKPYIQRATSLVDVDRDAKLGDTVNIDFEGFVDGTPFQGGKADGQYLELGSHSFIPGFEDQLVGACAGEQRTLHVTFPENYHGGDLAGKEAEFQVKVNNVQEKVVPEMDDEFAKDVSEFETLAEFRADLGKKLASRREMQAQDAFEEKLLDLVTENMTADIPDAMIQLRAQQMMEQYGQQIKAQGVTLEQYLTITGITPDMFRQQAMETAQRQVKVELALGAIAEAEGIEVTEDEIAEECKNLGEQYHMDAEQVRKIVPERDLRQDLSNQKAAQIVFDAAIIGEPPAPEETEKTEETKDAEDGKDAEKSKDSEKAESTEKAPVEEAVSEEASDKPEEASPEAPKAAEE